MKGRPDIVIIVAVAVCALVLIGEFTTYYPGLYDYDSEAEWSDQSVDYMVSATGSHPYDAVLISDSKHLSELAVYVDSTYDEYFDKAQEHSEFGLMEQEYYAQQLEAFLGMRSFDAVGPCDRDGLIDLIDSTMGRTDVGILVTSYALPSETYDGTSDCPLLKWIRAGGSLYWVGSEIGRFHVDGSGIHVVEDNQELFFGTTCINTSGSIYADTRIDNGLTEALNLNSSNLMNGLDVSKIEGAVGIGYSGEGFSSIALVPFGSGDITVFSGKFDIDQLDDIGQVVAAGITYDSKVLGHHEGEVVRGTEDGSFDIPAGAGDVCLYVYIGGTYVRYGEVSYADRAQTQDL